MAAWADEQATKLGKAPRSICLYMQVAQVIDSESATPLPISILDRPLREVPKAIKNVRVGLAPDAKHATAPRAPKQPPTVQVMGGRLVEAIADLAEADRTQALLDLLDSIAEVVAALPPQEAKVLATKAKKILGALDGAAGRGAVAGTARRGPPSAVTDVPKMISELFGLAAGEAQGVSGG